MIATGESPPAENNGEDREMELFEAVIALPDEEWDDYLVRSCGDSPGMLARLRVRCDRERRMRGFLLRPLVPRASQDRVFHPGDLAAGRFEIVREIAEGGMAVVYEATDRKLGQRVALKVPKPQFRGRLNSEVRSALQVTHPGICRLYEIHTGESAGNTIDFFTMEFLDGETLAQRLRRGRIPREQALLLTRQLCTAVAAAHARGVVHGDLKPGNVILAERLGIYGNCIVVDHGYALQSVYGHLSSIGVKVGEAVKKGQEIGRSGATGLAGGDHLHFTMQLDGVQINPVEWWDAHWIRDRILSKLEARD